MKISNNIIRTIFFLLCTSLVVSCQKEDKIFSEPYEKGKEALGIKIDAAQVPTPSFGLPGSTVSINATGLLPYKDELVFRFNGEDAEVSEVTDKGIKAIVPKNASTGVLSISIGDVVFFGPQYTVTGLINIDPTFRATRGANGPVSQVLVTNDEKRILIGGFTNYDNKGIIKPINRIVRTFPDGTYDASLRTGNGANGFLEAIVQLGDKYYLGGGFGGYDRTNSNISNLTRLNANGTLDTLAYDNTFRRPDQADTIKYYPTFNGGFNSAVNQLYEQDGKLIAVGGFRYYVSRTYDKPNRLETRDSVILDSIEIRQIARLNTDGSLDKSYRFNSTTNTGLAGPNGPIRSFMHEDGTHEGKMVVFGSFTRFDDQDKRYILRLNPDGTIDNTFNPGGVGADFGVSQVTYNSITKKYLIQGAFKAYNGVPIERLALLNEDGTLDDSFSPRAFAGGEPTFAKQLNDGLILVSGYFKTYDGIARNGFMILDSTGDLAEGYNATGLFSGRIYDIHETQAEDEKRALLIFGGFNRFNSLPVENIIRVILE